MIKLRKTTNKIEIWIGIIWSVTLDTPHFPMQMPSTSGLPLKPGGKIHYGFLPFGFTFISSFSWFLFSRCRFDIIKKLGQGTYGKVQLGINKETGQEVAIKTIKKSKIETEADLIRIRREVQIMSSVQHPNIIHIYEGKFLFGWKKTRRRKK